MNEKNLKKVEKAAKLVREIRYDREFRGNDIDRVLAEAHDKLHRIRWLDHVVGQE